MWWIQNSDGGEWLCNDLNECMKLILSAQSLEWKLQFIPKFKERVIEKPEVVLDTETGTVRDKIKSMAPIPLGRSGDLE